MVEVLRAATLEGTAAAITPRSGVPCRAWNLMSAVYKKVLPQVHRRLYYWRNMVEGIPDAQLRHHAIMAIAQKAFHCEGGAIYGLLAGGMVNEAINFIVAYQTISDYLDNLCDRSTSEDPEDFRLLHAAMLDAITPAAPVQDYYRHRRASGDGGYLTTLVQACQDTISQIPNYLEMAPFIKELAGYYSDLQILKHMRDEAREQRLKSWHSGFRKILPEMEWHEFCAATGSTIGIFAIVSSAMAGATREEAREIKDAYFPWMQGLHILLDYLIDEEEDKVWGDLNFCSYYPDDQRILERIRFFFLRADRSLARIQYSSFHRMIVRGLLGLYLAEGKVACSPRLRRLARRIGRLGGLLTLFVYINCLFYRSRG